MVHNVCGSTSGYEALRSMGRLKEGEGGEEGEEGGRGGGVLCERVPEDGMRSDGETSEKTEEDPISAQVHPQSIHMYPWRETRL